MEKLIRVLIAFNCYAKGMTLQFCIQNCEADRREDLLDSLGYLGFTPNVEIG